MGLEKAGWIRTAEKYPKHLFPRKDVSRIVRAFEKHNVPLYSYEKTPELITLHDAQKSFLGKGVELASALNAVVEGHLVPVARARQQPGIMGYVFHAPDLRKYSNCSKSKPFRIPYFNVTEAASFLETSARKVNALINAKIFTSVKKFEAKPETRRQKLVSAKQVRSFADQHESPESVAKSLGMSSKVLIWHLKRESIPVVAGAWFVRKKVAAKLRRSLGETA